MNHATDVRPRVVDRCSTELGELVLRQCGEHYELISDGMFLMDTRDGRSERALINEVLAVAPNAARVVIGGLGFGFSLETAVASTVPGTVEVIEIHERVIEWNREYLSERMSRAMADRRVRLTEADVGEWLASDDTPLDVLCLDTDNGPDWLSLSTNAGLYENGLARVTDRLARRGVLGVWSAHRCAEFEAVLRREFALVDVHEIPVARGTPDIVYVARCPRFGARSVTVREFG